jgi:hypothetical protein
MAFSPYLWLGKLAGPPGQHEQLVALYQLFRFGAGILMILATFDFLALFIPDRGNRRLALVLSILGGGLGWILVTMGKSSWLGSMPLEFYSPESFGFLSVYVIPHLALGRALMLWGLTIFLRKADESESIMDSSPPGSEAWVNKIPQVLGTRVIAQKHLKKGLSAGILWLLAGIAQPLAPAIGIAVAGCYLAVSGMFIFFRKSRPRLEESTSWFDQFRTGAIAVLIPLPLIIYNVWILRNDHFTKLWTGQNILLSPHPLHYLLAFGSVLPFAVIGARHSLQNHPTRGWFLITWALLLPLFAYAPIQLQRRLPDGIWVVLIGLAFIGLTHIQLPVLSKNLLYVFLCLLLLPSTLILFGGGILESSKVEVPIFRPADEIKAFDFLSDHAPADSVVLAAFRTGNALPAWAFLKVVIGHGPESVNLRPLEAGVREFYESDSCDSKCSTFLHENQVRYVIWGPAERALGHGDPGKMNITRLIDREGDYYIYEILTPK